MPPMRFRRTSGVFASWVAVLALLMAALAPAISHALRTRDGASAIEVCSSLGARWVLPDGSSTDPVPPAGQGHPFEHCPYCSLHSQALAIPPAPAVLTPAIATAELLPLAFPAAPLTLFAWVGAQPRAPPSFG